MTVAVVGALALQEYIEALAVLVLILVRMVVAAVIAVVVTSPSSYP